MPKTLFTQVNYDLNGLMSAVKMKQIGNSGDAHHRFLKPQPEMRSMPLEFTQAVHYSCLPLA